MTKRRESREQAFTLLFEKTVTGDSMEDIIEMAKEARDVVIDPYCEKLTALTELYLDEIDHTIEENLRGWSLRRLSKMTLTILRVAVCEMQFMRADDVPVSVSINEAVELAKIYGNEKDASYVNGVLSTIAKKLEGAKNETESEGLLYAVLLGRHRRGADACAGVRGAAAALFAPAGAHCGGALLCPTTGLAARAFFGVSHVRRHNGSGFGRTCGG